MGSGLNDIADRLTPSTPIELTYSAQPIAVGSKIATLFAHRAAAGGTGMDYEPYSVVNVGDPDAAQAEVDGVCGVGSQAGKMAYAFVYCNSKNGRGNFPAFRIIPIPFAQTGFGPADDAILSAQALRSDFLVSCYPANNQIMAQKMLSLAALISGNDRDLSGQFGSTVIFGSLETVAQVQAYNFNTRLALVAVLRDSNNAQVAGVDGDVAAGSPLIQNVASVAGIYPGAKVTGTGIPAGAFVGVITPTTVSLVDADGNDLPATVTAAAESLTFQNVVSQPEEIVAADKAAMMAQCQQPYNPINGLPGGLIPPRKRSDWIQINPNGDSEAYLKAGMSPYSIQPGNLVANIRARTTLTLLPDGVTAVTDYFDWEQLIKMNDYKESVYQVSIQPPFNDNPGGSLASQDGANKFNDECLRIANDFQTAGMFQNVKKLAKFFKTVVSATSRGRYDSRFPVDCVPGLYVNAVNILAVSDAANFTV